MVNGFWGKVARRVAVALSIAWISAGCNQKNLSYAVPPVIDYLTVTPWQIDSIVNEGNNDTVRLSRANGFANSYIRFTIGTASARYVFKDVYDASLLGPSSSDIPSGDSVLFRYSEGVWSLNQTNDSIVYKPDNAASVIRWQIVDTAHSGLVVSYMDTIRIQTDAAEIEESIIAKKVFFSRVID